jgi:hypothetical protein
MQTARSWQRRLPFLFVLMLLVPWGVVWGQTLPDAGTTDGLVGASACARWIQADVVALDQPWFWNRIGAVEPQGMIFALKRDVVPINSTLGLTAGNVQLRPDKRPRPLILRMNVGDCLQINFTNLLAQTPKDKEQPATRTASVHVHGMQLVDSIASDGSNVGKNLSSLVKPDGSAIYKLYAEREGGYFMYSAAATTGGEGDGGSLGAGLFGAITVQPKGAEWYRSQITADDLKYATKASTVDGHPLINYQAVYPVGHKYAGLPVLAMLQNGKIVHSDLTAIITGPAAGRFPAGTYPKNPVEPDREQPFREFALIYHDEFGAVQAFPEFEDPQLKFTLHGVRDAFAINYGTGGIGAEILANRFGVGPVAGCTECKFEEFFLSSWSLGDPAMVVDVPANAPCTPDQIQNHIPCLKPGLKATKAFYPDDPSNVYHSYLSDHTKFRIVHAGPKEHHIHHLHAHQWVHTPDSDESSYLDSQAIGPGASFTLEMVHNGSGNRNQTAGDSIFHCHFYPHFAMGMWSLWRVHDVFEFGTALDLGGRPAKGSRAYPDAEILAGTPIPALVPMPTLAMAPLPEATATIVNGQVQITGTGNPGYPFFVPAVAGHRPPHPPLDTVDDGGLPRHVIVGGTFTEKHTRLDFDKTLLTADARFIPEGGSAVEHAAMKYHGIRLHPSFTPGGAAANFVTNGLPPVAGAPYADPCITDNGLATGAPRTYKAAAIQLDVKLNKAGWHFPQQRILTLWGDVAATRNGTRPPEPFFFRANTGDCINYYHTNLVPNVYAQDDFEIRTPTDILGQHIHLVKFDVTSSDGSGNGWNYEDGTFSPDEVIERINAINAFGGALDVDALRKKLTPKPHPFFGTLGAQTTVQRWYADDVLDNAGNDRTLRTVFTHDHFGPSTHQQVGLYAGLVIEPNGSKWRHSETGEIFGGRFDGGPTSWRADILTASTADSYREFLLEFADMQHAYKPNNNRFPDPANVINPPGKEDAGLPFLLEPANPCPISGAAPPCPEAITAAEPGTMVVNYRNEPIALRVQNPVTNTQAAGLAGDLSYVFRSDIARANPALNVQPAFYPPLTGSIKPGDPYTPLLRAYEDDKVQVRILVGAHEEGHNFAINGIKWLFEPSDPNSGYRASQMMGISEHFEFLVPRLPKEGVGAFADYLYTPGRSTDDMWNGLWGLMRAYGNSQADLLPLPSNPNGGKPITNTGDFNGICPKTAPARNFDVTAALAKDILSEGTLIYNHRINQGGILHDPTAIMFVRTSEIGLNGKLDPTFRREPLVLHAAAGDCINLTLRNKLPAVAPDLAGFNTLPMIVNEFNANQIVPSSTVGLHPQLLFVDVTRGDGQEVGFNPAQTATPGHSVTYQWYAGDLEVSPTGFATPRPIEFGATNLLSSDPMKHANKGAIGGLIIEPQGSTWTFDPDSHAAVTVKTPAGDVIRDFAVLFQNDINFRYGSDGSAVKLIKDEDDPEDSGHKAINYRTEPMWKRMNFAPETPFEITRTFDFTNVLSNTQVGGDPETPVFVAHTGTTLTRFRMLQPGGHQRNNVFVVHGHVWREEPYLKNSTILGGRAFSEFTGAQMGVGPGSHFNILLRNGAGGAFSVTGDYLYRTFNSFQFDGGMWGILRVIP